MPRGAEALQGEAGPGLPAGQLGVGDEGPGEVRRHKGRGRPPRLACRAGRRRVQGEINRIHGQ